MSDHIGFQIDITGVEGFQSTVLSQKKQENHVQLLGNATKVEFLEEITLLTAHSNPLE